MTFQRFVEDINARVGITLPPSWTNLTEVQLAQRFLGGLNEYFFQTYDGIGTTNFDGEEFQYFSEFHKFWEANHREILRARIDEQQAQLAAQCLSQAVKKYGTSILRLTHDTHGLNPAAVAQVRFLTANQDFRKPPEDPFGKYLDDPSRFDAEEVARDPEGFISFIGVTRLSQSDKRADYAANAARFLLDNHMVAAEIAKKFGEDAVQIRSALVNTDNMGYGSKKANMFIRDMVDLKVWPALLNFAEIDVASDVNTMKLALRARVLKTDVPLLSSFLDIFGHQYEYIDHMSAKAWRVVWEKWCRVDKATSLSSPCEMDALLYHLGRDYCKEMVMSYICERGHKFPYFGGRIRKCRVCRGGTHCCRAATLSVS